MKIVNLSEHTSILEQYLHEIRDTTIQKDRKRFVQNLERIGAISAYEISKELSYSSNQAHTPVANATTKTLSTQPVVATIIRAGLPPYSGFLQIFDDADSAFLAAYRQLDKDGVMESVIGYSSSPNLDGRPLIIADTMIATGTTIVDIYNKLLEYGAPSQVFVSGVIVSQPAIDFLQAHIPNIILYAATIDKELNERFFIVPGLGDAGDISYGEKFEKS